MRHVIGAATVWLPNEEWTEVFGQSSRARPQGIVVGPGQPVRIRKQRTRAYQGATLTTHSNRARGD